MYCIRTPTSIGWWSFSLSQWQLVGCIPKNIDKPKVIWDHSIYPMFFDLNPHDFLGRIPSFPMKLHFFLEVQLKSPDATQHPALCSMKCALARVPMGFRGPGTRTPWIFALEGTVNGTPIAGWFLWWKFYEILSIFMGFGGTPVLENHQITMNRWYQPFPK